jgi:hypothetical protein
MFLPVDENQFKFRGFQRDDLPNINIVRSLNISRQAVSRALISMNKCIEDTLLEMAQSNQIEIESINVKCGILFGKLRGLA